MLKKKNGITEIASLCLDNNGRIIEESRFTSLVNPGCKINSIASTLTSITDNMVKNANGFDIIGNDFIVHILNILNDYQIEKKIIVEYIIFVGHHIRRFDMPFLFYHLMITNNSFPESLKNKFYLLDTLELARGTIERNGLPFPNDYKLVTLYNYCTDKDFSEEAHRALADVNATTEILLYPTFWFERMNNIWKINSEGYTEQLITGLTYKSDIATPNVDSDTDSEPEDGDILVDTGTGTNVSNNFEKKIRMN